MTMPPRYVRTPDGRLVAVPAPVVPPEEVEEVEEVEEEPSERGAVDEAAEMTEVSEEDVLGKPEDNLDQEEDLSDLFEVGDIMGDAPEQPQRPKPKRRLIRRTNRRYLPPQPPGIISPR